MSFNKLPAVLIIAILSSLMVKAQSTVPKDVIIVHCDADTTQSYSLYLPPGYNSQNLYPVIFLFDPIARGTVAVSLFKTAASECGFIVAGSDNSKNGPLKASVNAANAMFTDIFKKYKIDATNIYLGGLSGGARLATTIAMNANGIAGVIACCASFNGPAPLTQLSWTFAGITGDLDFNYSEMQQMHLLLEKTQSVNELLVFKGRHGWPPPKFLYEALLWSYLQHAKKSPATDSLFSKFKLLTDSENTAAHSLVEISERYRNLLSVDPNNEIYKQKLSALEATKAYQDQSKYFDEIRTAEEKYQKRIREAFQKIVRADTNEIESKSWWNAELNSLNKLLLTKLPADSNYVIRQKDFINTNAALEYRDYYSEKQYKEAREFLTVLTVFDKDNPLVYYRMALISAANNDQGNTISNLEIAIKKGYANKQQVQKEPLFEFLRSNEKVSYFIK